MAQDLVDFQDIYETVLAELKIPTSDTTTLGRVKRDINNVYINEVVPAARWPWLLKRIDKKFPAAYNSDGSDTADVTEGSTTVTLSSSIPVTEGSKAGYFFKNTGYDEIYRITSHTAGSDTLTLETEYTGATNTAAGFVIWTDAVDLPQDARETIDIYHDFKHRPLIPVGAQKLNEYAQWDRDREDRPEYYSTDTYTSSATPELESNRQRQVRLWPARNDDPTTLHIDYTQEATALNDDTDEPLLPIEDRIVLVYGALRQSWIRDRNPEVANINAQLYNRKLQSMESRYQDSTDLPRIEVNDQYLRRARNRRKSRYGIG